MVFLKSGQVALEGGVVGEDVLVSLVIGFGDVRGAVDRVREFGPVSK